ncbi:MAG TPA: dihydrodipicolinate synthase family protein [Rhodopila sp.]|uniref:dihydrodipicolinate synthase family protein n=1 Tax=Rhodopila sp. TaxID=2480087 RepID=UPI002CCF8517|nr:dihydrodipicolinate synthase family protein [Rhodopila sp.]HVY17870.1 dihydrodipicolinate synthase family protein [Rhodopila sp.]
MTMILDSGARGVFPISVTPFHDDGAIDTASMDRMTDFFLQLGVPGFTLLGILGEASKLSAAESLDLLKRVVRRVDGRTRIIAGVQPGGFNDMQAFVKAVMDTGASGIMIGPVPGLRTEEQVLGYFEAFAERIGPAVPIALQDYPQASGVFMSPATMGRIVERVPNVQVLKHEEGSALRKISQLRAQEKPGGRRRVSILVGNSALHLPQELARGVDGANTGVAFPEMLIEVCNRFFAGKPDGGEDLYDIFLPLIRHEWQPGIGLAIRKEVFRRRGLIASARTRAPGPVLDSADHAELSHMLARLMRRLKEAGEEGLISSHEIKD